ncbi:MAG: hypothetical protein IPL52_18205 [Flavobacteriales bacterium]|nr:hypothetical protein [Flavobacteriales bacterium]
MHVTPKRFFDFCATHVPLLHAIAMKPGDVSEAQVRQLIRNFSDGTEELPETTWERLNELQIIVPIEEGSSHYVMSQPLLQLLNFLYNDALPTSRRRSSRATSLHWRAPVSESAAGHRCRRCAERSHGRQRDRPHATPHARRSRCDAPRRDGRGGPLPRRSQ